MNFRIVLSLFLSVAVLGNNAISNTENEIPGEPLSSKDFLNARKISTYALGQTGDGKSILEQSGAFEGDIVGISAKDILQKGNGSRNAIINLAQRWPGRTIPYVISSSYTSSERSVIARAIQEFHSRTCIRFVPRTNHADYIFISRQNGCRSNVGRIGGQQVVSLDNGCVEFGIIIHELMHAVGFWHEQSRADRDDYVQINWGNIQSGQSDNFLKYTWNQIQSLGVPYDLGSVMHYGPYDFAKNPQIPTIIPKRNTGVEMGQRRGFSNTDVYKINRLYGC